MVARIGGRDSASVDERRLRRFSAPSLRCLQIWADHVFDTADSRILQYGLKISIRLGSVSSDGFKRDIEADLVSILEEIGKRLFARVNPDGNAIDSMSFDTGT